LGGGRSGGGPKGPVYKGKRLGTNDRRVSNRTGGVHLLGKKGKLIIRRENIKSFWKACGKTK